MFIREDFIGDMASVQNTGELSLAMSEFVSDITAHSGVVSSFGNTVSEYKKQMKIWYDNISFLIGL